MSHDPLDYPHLIQESLRDVIRRSLDIVAREGLPGEHHFYITFRTDAPGVRLSGTLTDRYPEEMTIVVQHQYRDLEVERDHFSMVLFFSGIAHSIRVPFSAVTAFLDPSVSFQLLFSPSTDSAESSSGEPESLPLTGGETGAAADNVVPFRKK